MSEGGENQRRQRQKGEDTTPSAGPGEAVSRLLTLRRAREGWEQPGTPAVNTRPMVHRSTGEVQSVGGKTSER